MVVNILQESRQASTRDENMDFGRIQFFRELASRIMWETVLDHRGAYPLEEKKVCCSSRTISSKDKNDPSQSVRKWAGITEDQAGLLGKS